MIALADPPGVQFTDVVETIGALIALGALMYAARGVNQTARSLEYTHDDLKLAASSLELSRKTGKAQFWLDLREHMSRHDEVHRKLRPHGEWTAGDGRPIPGRPRLNEL